MGSANQMLYRGITILPALYTYIFVYDLRDQTRLSSFV